MEGTGFGRYPLCITEGRLMHNNPAMMSDGQFHELDDMAKAIGEEWLRQIVPSVVMIYCSHPVHDMPLRDNEAVVCLECGETRNV